MPVAICLQCFMQAYLDRDNERSSTAFIESLEEHMRTHHPDEAETTRARAVLQQRLLAEKHMTLPEFILAVMGVVAEVQMLLDADEHTSIH